MKTRAFLVFTVLTTASLPGYADGGRPGAGVNQRQHNQHERINQGVRSGELNAREAHRLNQEQRQIRAEERAYRADGTLDPAERKDLRQDQNQASRHIYKEKHDAQDRKSPRDPAVNARQATQHDRIKQGVRSGELTRDEAKQLAQEQRAIRTEERAYKADGVLTPAERKDLHQDLNQASKDVYEQKHDAEKR